MRNNKNIDRADIKIGMRVKIGLPTSYVFHNQKDRHKRLSWWKGKIAEIYPNGAFTVMVYPKYFIGRIMVLPMHDYRIVRQLK